MAYYQHILGLQLDGSVELTVDPMPSFKPVDLPNNIQLGGPVKIRLWSEPIPRLWERCELKGAAEQAQKAAAHPVHDPWPSTVTTVRVGARTFSHEGFAGMNWILTALRLSVVGLINGGAYACFDDDEDTERRGGGSWKPFDIMKRPMPSEVLSEGQCHQLSNQLEVVAALTSRFHQKDLSIALRYFERTFTPNTPAEDRILDLTIALEALLSPSDRAELRHRVAQRTARLVGRDARDAARIHALCLWAYDIRSSVAHGTFKKFKESEWKKAARWQPKHCRSVGPVALVGDLHRVVRQVILACATLEMSRREMEVALDQPMPRKELKQLRAAVKTMPLGPFCEL